MINVQPRVDHICIPVAVIPDQIVESTEIFLVILETSDQDVVLNASNSSVSIMDDDGMHIAMLYKFTNTGFTSNPLKNTVHVNRKVSTCMYRYFVCVVLSIIYLLHPYHDMQLSLLAWCSLSTLLRREILQLWFVPHLKDKATESSKCHF